jgi:hypothetical protein
VTLDDDVLIRVKEEGRKRGVSFKVAVNELLRAALTEKPIRSTEPFKIEPLDLGYRPELNYDSTEALLEFGEGPFHR